MPETPDHSAISFQTASDYPKLLEANTENSILQYMQILAGRLHDADRNWGYLTKTPGEKHLTLPDGQIISVDCFIYRLTNQVVDCITNAVETTPAGPSWGYKEKRPDNNWYPIEDGGSIPSPGDCNCQEELEALQSQIDDLKNRMTAQESKPAGVLEGRKIALKSNANGKYLRVRNDQPDKYVEATSDVSQSFEEYIIKDMD